MPRRVEYTDGGTFDIFWDNKQLTLVHKNIQEAVMSMRGELISKEYQKMVFIDDVDGKEYSCYQKDVSNFDEKKGLSSEQKKKCTDLSLVLGDSW